MSHSVLLLALGWPLSALAIVFNHLFFHIPREILLSSILTLLSFLTACSVLLLVFHSAFFALLLVFVLASIFASRYYLRRKRRRHHAAHGVKTIGIVHPNCDQRGGGERVLWEMLSQVLDATPALRHARVVIYTASPPDAHDQIVPGAETLFGLRFAPHIRARVHFEHLAAFAWIRRAQAWPFSLLCQGALSLLPGALALYRTAPDVVVDTAGYPWLYPLLRVWGGCPVAAYTHYPSVCALTLTQPLQRLDALRRDAETPWHKRAVRMGVQLAYVVYHLALCLHYRVCGRSLSLALANSEWTAAHLRSVWAPWAGLRLVGQLARIPISYPPCGVQELLGLPLATQQRKPWFISIGQFRPEKDHRLQIDAFTRLLESSDLPAGVQPRLFLIGGASCDADRRLLLELKHHARPVAHSCEFLVGVSAQEKDRYLQQALGGLHTMWCEHFGICVVEYMASGVVPIAHRSGGPERDIVLPTAGGDPSGFLATTAEEYAAHMRTLLDAYVAATQGQDPRALQTMQSAARERAQHFETHFKETVRQHMAPLLDMALCTP